MRILGLILTLSFISSLSLAQMGNLSLLDSARMNSVNAGLIGRWNIGVTNPLDLVGTYNLTTQSSSIEATNIVSGHASGQGGVLLLSYPDGIDAANIDGRRVPGDFTNTGLALDSDGTFWIGNFTTGDIVHVTNSATPTEFTLLSTLGDMASNNQLQGVAIDTWDDTIWYTEFSTMLVKHCTKAGVSIPNGWNTGFTNNGCAYEPGRSSLWVVENIAAGSTQKLHRFDTNGVEQEVVEVSPGSTLALDGIAYSAHNDTLWVTADSNTGSTIASTILNINKSTGATNYHFQGLSFPEGIAIPSTGTNLLYCSDGLFHGGHYTGNRVYNSTTNGLILDRLITNQMTISVWCKPNVTNSSAGLVVKEIQTASTAEFEVMLISAATFFRITTTDGNTYTCSAGTPLTDTNRWYHIACTYDGSRMLNYLNGQVDKTNATASGSVMANTRAINFGRRDTSSTFNGTLSDVRIYNRALTASEIKYLSNR